MTDMKPVASPDQITVLQGVSVMSAFRQNKLMHYMVDAWLKNAFHQGKAHALAEVEVHNIASWSVFLSQGLKITGIGKDPDDGALLYNLHGGIPDIVGGKSSFNHASAPMATCPMDDFKKQQDMLDNGYVISGWQKASREFILTPNP
jgi:hypothetical protein